MEFKKEDIEEILKYFDIIKVFSGNKGDDAFTSAKLEEKLNQHLQALSDKYDEEVLWKLLRLTEDERVYFVASGIVFKKHGIMVKVLEVDEGKGVYIKFKGDKEYDVKEKEKIVENKNIDPYVNEL